MKVGPLPAFGFRPADPHAEAPSPVLRGDAGRVGDIRTIDRQVTFDDYEQMLRGWAPETTGYWAASEVCRQDVAIILEALLESLQREAALAQADFVDDVKCFGANDDYPVLRTWCEGAGFLIPARRGTGCPAPDPASTAVPLGHMQAGLRRKGGETPHVAGGLAVGATAAELARSRFSPAMPRAWPGLSDLTAAVVIAAKMVNSALTAAALGMLTGTPRWLFDRCPSA